ncbi:alpha/beta fold hydrolase [Shinella sp. BYT-45]|uniref:alpha/beta fold hydrolase n=1 Tax=Shinella sp. BYT-45 TaxID=3377377 RepID=UPI00397EA210
MTTFISGGLVRANDIRQHYLHFGGKGPQMLVLPGITSPAITWAEFADELGKDFDVYVLDMRGRGLSEAGPALDYSINAMAADAAAFAAVMGLENYHLLGHSMGGRIAPVAVTRYGATPKKLMIIDPPITGPGQRGHGATHEWFTDQISAGARGDMTVEDMRPYFPRWRDDQLALRVEWIHTCDPRAIIDFRIDVLEDDIHSELPKLEVPTHLMIGGQSPLITPEEQAEIAALAPKLEIHRIPEAGHMIPWDTPEIFFRLCREFFARA